MIEEATNNHPNGITKLILALHKDVSRLSERMDERFTGVEARLDGHDQRFDHIEARLDNHDKQFVSINAQFEKQTRLMNHRFDRVETHLAAKTPLTQHRALAGRVTRLEKTILK